ncbi:MAG: hypothetical protein HFF43_05280 [Lawsonibacter sp.]|nr:hypothetical protein [Lawsonibacter sp.]
MDIQSNLLDLQTAAQRITDGLSAIQVMIIGLDSAGSQYAGAFHAVWDYLASADVEFQKCLTACINDR